MQSATARPSFNTSQPSREAPRQPSNSRCTPVALRRRVAPARARLRVQACHRCLLDRPQRHLISLPRQLSGGSSSNSSSNTSSNSSRNPIRSSSALKEGTEGAEETIREAGPAAAQEAEDSAGVKAALAALKFYKAAISPLLPNACRFLPTCSVYSMDAFKRYGVSKGVVMTTWRLLRCTPWGNSGYDPAVWPPPGLEFMFKADDSSSA
ncbi:hypothetical protein ACK3TF_002617 [Chlorella vulgaris]